MPPRSAINQEKLAEKTFKRIDLEVTDIVKFKGTRDRQGVRKILRMSPHSYFCITMIKRKGRWEETNFTSTNGVDKLTHVLLDEEWVKVIP